MRYVEKLRKVLLAITKEKAIPSISDTVLLSTPKSIFYHHTGIFRVDKEISEAKPSMLISIYTNVSSGRLLLDCSLRFFSEGRESDDYPIHSSFLFLKNKK